ncbi:nitroreductase family protein [Methanomassiliicoccales archaeon LGM-DZ1]|nr:nitroreductase family protein [Methanomassiliicoccales archaeon LGM-DZ1]
MNLMEMGLRRRSVRRYGPTPIPDDVLDYILDFALTAPSSFGHRPVEFVVVRDRETIRKTGDCKSLGGSQIVGADAVIVVMADTHDKRMSEFWIEDASIASTYILLAAEEKGLGACWVHIRNRTGRRGTSDEEIRSLLGVPEGYTVLNLVALGEKGESKKPYTPEDFDRSKIHRGRF